MGRSGWLRLADLSRRRFGPTARPVRSSAERVICRVPVGVVCCHVRPAYSVSVSRRQPQRQLSYHSIGTIATPLERNRHDSGNFFRDGPRRQPQGNGGESVRPGAMLHQGLRSSRGHRANTAPRPRRLFQLASTPFCFSCSFSLSFLYANGIRLYGQAVRSARFRHNGQPANASHPRVPCRP